MTAFSTLDELAIITGDRDVSTAEGEAWAGMGTDGDGEFDSPRAGRAFDALVSGAHAAVVLRVTLDRIRAEHEPSEHDPTACATCGSSGEYPVDWPCATRQLADEAIARVPA